MTVKVKDWNNPSVVDKVLFLTCVDGVHRKWINITHQSGLQRDTLWKREELSPTTIEYVKRKV